MSSPVEAARSLAPQIEAAADRIERDRQLPAELVDALFQAGMFSMLQPAEYGGAELDLPTYVRVVEELARADGSVAWCVGQANGLWNYFAHLDPEVAREVLGRGRTIMAHGPGEGNRPGRAVATTGGYRVSGRWMFASGICHTTWVMGACELVSADGSPRLDADKPALRAVMMPRSSVKINDIWHVSGLRGTGSHGFIAEDVFVPAGYAMHVVPEKRQVHSPLYQFSANGLFAPAFASVALGLAHSSVAAIIDFASGKVPRGYERPISQSPTVQASVALSKARLEAARQYLHQTLTSVWKEVVRTGEARIDQRVAVRLAATHAIHEAAAVVDTAYALAGSNAIFEDRPFERRFRDVHAVTQQLQGRRAHYEHVGAYLLGLEPAAQFL